MKKLLLALLIAAAPLAALAYKIPIQQDASGRYIGFFERSDGQAKVLLTLIPCPTPQYADRLVAAEYNHDDALTRRGCWKADGQGKGGVMIYYTNGTTERDWLDRYQFVDEVPTL
jgi:hypothetical protein